MSSPATSPRSSVLLSPRKSIASVLSSGSDGSPKSNRSSGIFSTIRNSYRNSFYGPPSSNRNSTRLTNESVNSFSSMAVNFDGRPDELTDGHVDYVAKAIDVYEREAEEYERRVWVLFEDRYADWFDAPRSDDEERLFQVDHWDHGFIEQWTSMENARTNAKYFLGLCVPKDRSRNIQLMEAKFESLEQRLEACHQKALYHKQRYEVFAEKIRDHVKACNDKAALEKLRAVNAEKTEALQRAKANLESLSEELNETKQRCRANQRALDERQAEQDHKTNFQHIERERSYEDKIVKLDDQLRQAKLNTERLTNDIYDAEAKLTEARKQIRVLQAQLLTSELPRDQRYNDLLQQNAVLGQRLEESEGSDNQAFSKLLRENTDLKESLRRANDQVQHIEDLRNRAEAATKVAEDNAQKLKHLEQVHIADTEDRAAAHKRALLNMEKALKVNEAENLDLLERLKAADAAADKQRLDNQLLEARLEKRAEQISEIQATTSHDLEKMTQVIRDFKVRNAEVEDMLDGEAELVDENLRLHNQVLSLTKQLQEMQAQPKTPFSSSSSSSSSTVAAEQPKPQPRHQAKIAASKAKPLPAPTSRSTPSRAPPPVKKTTSPRK